MRVARKGRGRVKELDIMAPPPEQLAGGAFVVEDITDKRHGGGTIAIGKAYRRRPMIDILHDAGMFSREEWKALRHYRHHADLVDRSPMRDSLCLQRGGSGIGPTVTTLNAAYLVRQIESAAGSLADILRAVVVYDTSLSQWAMSREGAIEQCRERKGKMVCAMEPKRKSLEIAKLEIRMAAKRVEAELAA